MAKIIIPVLEEVDSADVVKKLKKFGETASEIKKCYPSVWNAIAVQYKLEYSTRQISEELFDKKLEVLLLQDDELRNN